MRINGVEKPLRTALRNGDVVEIVVGEKIAPGPGVENLTKTGRAKSAQRRLQRSAKRDQFARLGRDLVQHALHRYGHELAETALQHAAEHLGKADEEELFVAVGEGSIKASAVAVAAFPGLEEKVRKDLGRRPMEREKAKLYVTGSELTAGVALHFAECCTPIPGDRIIGVQIPGRGVEVHTIDCEQLAPLEEDDSVTWVDLGWTTTAMKKALATGRILVTVENKRGVLAELCRIIAENQGDILNLRMLKRTTDFFDMVFDIEVADAKHLTNILAAIRTSKAVKEVDRVKG